MTWLGLSSHSRLSGSETILLFGRRLGEPAAGWLATAAMAGSFVASVLVFVGLRDRPEGDRRFVQTLFEWVPAGDFSVDVGFLVDPLSVTMTLFITGVGALIHLYSIGYMHGDSDFSKFFVYLNLFAFSMLMLVLGDNMLLTFLGWEGRGRVLLLADLVLVHRRIQRISREEGLCHETASVTGASWSPCSSPSQRWDQSSTSTCSTTLAGWHNRPQRRSPCCC